MGGTIECWELKIETHERLKRTLFIRTKHNVNVGANSFLSNSTIHWDIPSMVRNVLADGVFRDLGVRCAVIVFFLHVLF